ncbi:DUF4331 family protein [Plesiocystis pacifica]|uniref:DUF4331 family protein n=1 Tax=Plesiocystis pacifica TaxID=191768 RepID=UPI000A310F3D|nr:DUF4331 family protein [Plesiocystis pacifica]
MASKLWTVLGVGAFVGLVVASGVVIAADHDEADTTSFDDAAADIGDLYAFHDGERLTLILTVDGYKLRTEETVYDDGVLYGVHIDTDGDNVADHDLWARFGSNAAGEWAVQVEGIPGADGPLVSPVDEVLEVEGGASIFAGTRDDPFFFDLDGFQDTLATGTVAFNPERDFVAIKNTVAIVVEFDHAALGSETFGVWATTGRQAQ